MSNPRKAKGTRWETAVTRALNAFWGGRHGLKAYKPRQEGFRDVGDIHASPFVIQAKDWKDVVGALREGLDGAEKQKRNAGEPYGVATIKRARRPVGDAYAVMTLETFARLVLRIRTAEALIREAVPEPYRGAYFEDIEDDLAQEFPR